MKILSIETSCDETALSVLEFENDRFKILSQALISQVDKHQKFGGVYPSLAKREHTLNVLPLIEQILMDISVIDKYDIDKDLRGKIELILQRHSELKENFFSSLLKYKKPDIDYIAVTVGPGLEPALWVGVNFAKALAILWNKKLIPVNHMEGHIVSSYVNEDKLLQPNFPAIALLISGGHTELVLSNSSNEYEKIGETRDDSVGEAFDKVARLLGLPYPGGPHIERYAQIAREENIEDTINFPRPLITNKKLDFSFSGLKTAARYKVQEFENISDQERKIISLAFENAATEVLVSKTKSAIEDFNAKTLIVGGGVSANKRIRKELLKLGENGVDVLLPPQNLSTDNAIMIAIAAYGKNAVDVSDIESVKADAKLSF